MGGQFKGKTVPNDAYYGELMLKYQNSEFKELKGYVLLIDSLKFSCIPMYGNGTMSPLFDRLIF